MKISTPPWAALLHATLIAAACLSASAASVQPTGLRCEYRVNPLGIDDPAPRLGWLLDAKSSRDRESTQSAYQILVATDPGRLRPGKADAWDSGEVKSAATSLIPYSGRPLASGERCYWAVRSRDDSGDWSEWSPPAQWVMGLLQPSDWSAEWIGTGENYRRGAGNPSPDTAPPDPWFRKVLVLDSRPERALAYLASVGYHELWINGHKVGDAVLQPSVTDHSKRARYDTYDIADRLQPGTNVIGLWLGSGWSIYPKFESTDKPRAPIARAQFQVTSRDGRQMRFITDASWKTHPSPSSLLGVWDFTNFGGESYDARLEQPDWAAASFDDSAWAPVQVYHPNLLMSADPVEPNRLQTEVRPLALSEPKPGTYRFDMGSNFAGFVELKVRGQPGDRVELQFSEQESKVMTHRLRDVYVLGPAGEGKFRNRFNYGVGRWITVTGLRSRPSPQDIRGWLVRTDYDRASAFECSNPLYNRIQAMVLWTYENLSLGGYLVDCPQRERMGYGGDAHATTTTGLRNFGVASLYSKWAEDWRDAQGRTSSWGPGNAAAEASAPGSLPYTAPTYWGGGGPGWCGYVVHLPSEVWQETGDRRLVEKMLPTVERWLTFLESKQRENLLRRWGGEWDFLGDWLWPGATGVNGDTRETLCFNNCYWIYNLQTAARLAGSVGKTEQASNWNRRAAEVRAAVHREFYNAADASYADGSQACQALALVAQVPPAELRPAVWKRFEAEITDRRKGHIHAGITGGAFVFKALREADRDDLIATMVAKEDYPGWGDMLKEGATTFWESWENNPDLSYLHSSYLYVGAWFVEGILGIRPVAEAAGYERFVLRPGPLDRPDLTWAKGHHDTVRGRINVAWTRKADRFDLEVTVPPNTRAAVHLPTLDAARIQESGASLVRSKGIRVLGVERDRVVLDVASGNYRFSVAAR